MNNCGASRNSLLDSQIESEKDKDYEYNTTTVIADYRDPVTQESVFLLAGVVYPGLGMIDGEEIIVPLNYESSEVFRSSTLNLREIRKCCKLCNIW